MTNKQYLIYLMSGSTRGKWYTKMKLTTKLWLRRKRKRKKRRRGRKLRKRRTRNKSNMNITRILRFWLMRVKN